MSITKLLTFQQRFKHLRGEMTKSEMADLLGVPPIYITRFENSDTKPGFEFLLMVHSKLHVNLNWLVAGTGTPYWSNEAISKDGLEMFTEIIKISRDAGIVLEKIYSKDNVKEALELVKLTKGFR